ncbi:DNA polymerase phi-domain-containing protein [Chytriomyces sp. MP71]|nr:DNA polymerase phi-domain-containing protein [Chytriomyces sp. MP71]
MTATTASQAPSATPGTLQLYWDLASLDGKVRLTAALKLSTVLAEVHTPSKDGTTIIKDDLDAAYNHEIVYALKRLLRGLASSRDGARQGFTLALSEVLRILKDDPAFGISLVLDLLESYNALSGSVKGQEEREMYFARIFGMHAIANSGLLTASQTSNEDIMRLTQSLLTCATAKSYLSLASYDILIKTAIAGIESNADWVPSMISDVIGAGMGTEGVWFVIVVQDEMKASGFKYDWKSALKGTWDKPASLLHISHKTRLVNAIKETTTTSPKLHPIFVAIISHVFSSPNPTLTLQDFWVHMIDDPLFNSTHDRKFIGFLVFQKCLEAASEADDASKFDVGVLFSKSFLRCLINSLGKGDDAVLFKIAKATAKQISTISSTSRQIGLQVVFQLIGKNGHQRFDSITRTKTVESIVGSLNEVEVQTYVKYLMDMVVKGGADGLKTDEASTSKSIASTRMWALDQLHSLLKAPKIPKSEGWIQTVLRFLCVHSLFIVEKSGENVVAIEGGELGSTVREYCRGRFFAGLAEGNGISLLGADDKKLPAGVMQNGEYWAYDLVQFILELDGKGSTTPGKKSAASTGAPIVRAVHSLEARSLEARNMAIKEITAFRTKVASLQKATPPDSNLIAQYKSFELLFAHVLLQVYTEPVDAVNILNELKSCSDLVFTDNQPPVSTPNKKRKANEVEDEDEEETPNPIDVIVDILLSFLAKPSALFRGVVENVFRVFCPVLTSSGLDLIFDILKAKSGVAGAEELFEQEGENVDDEDGDDDDVVEIDAPEPDEGDDDDEDEDQDDDDEDDDEDDMEEDVDEFRNKVKAALGGMIVDGAAEEDETEPAMQGVDNQEGDALGDDDMEAFDDKLAEIFRERKKLKMEKRDAKQQVLHFKLRAVDLLEIFIRKQPSNPLILHLIIPSLHVILDSGDTEDSRELFNKMVNLVKSKLSNIKEFPKIASVERGCELLKEVQDLAANKAPSSAFVGLASSVSLMIVKTVSHSFPEGITLPMTASEPAKTPLSKKQKKASAAAASPAPVDTLSPVAKVYAASLKDFLTKKSKLQPSLFLDVCNRYPALALQFIPLVAETIAAGEAEKGFKIAQGLNIIAACLQKLPVKEYASHKETLTRLHGVYSSALTATLKLNEDKGVTVARIKEFSKPSIAIIKRLKKALENDDAFASLKGALEAQASGDVAVALKPILAAI